MIWIVEEKRAGGWVPTRWAGESRSAARCARAVVEKLHPSNTYRIRKYIPDPNQGKSR